MNIKARIGSPRTSPTENMRVLAGFVGKEWSAPSSRRFFALGCVALAISLAACQATAPTKGADSGMGVGGAAAGSNAHANSGSLERCTETLGTVRIEEDTNASWYGYYQSNYRMGSTVPMLRNMIQQSNCFVIVERGRSMATIEKERSLARSNEARASTTQGQGQMVAADYTLSPEILMSERSTSGVSVAAGNVASRAAGVLGSTLRSLSGSGQTNEAGTSLLLLDNRSSVQVASAVGYSKNIDFGVLGGLVGGNGSVGGASAFASTPQGKIVVAAFVDSFNKMVVALRNYKPQQVRGGLGEGGRLAVQGGQTEAAREAAASKGSKK